MDAANERSGAQTGPELARFTVDDRTRPGDASTDGGGGVVIGVTGELDAQSGAQLRTLLAQAFDRGPDEVVVDLREVSFIDSVGLSVLVTAHNRGESQGVPFSVRSPSAPCRRVFEITRLVDVLHLT
jgi:stage II sporulation protein AA (anti-sigma F factor antagonist)